MKGQRAQRSQQRAKETKKEEKPESYSKPEPDTNIVCSRYRELAADHTPPDQAAGENRSSPSDHRCSRSDLPHS